MRATNPKIAGLGCCDVWQGRNLICLFIRIRVPQQVVDLAAAQPGQAEVEGKITQVADLRAPEVPGPTPILRDCGCP